MRQLHIVQDQLEYVGLLTAPTFLLFANPAALASGLYHAFAEFHSGTDDISFATEAAHPLRQTCSINLGVHGTYTVSLERVEWTRPNAWAWELDSSVLERGDAWLRSLRAAGALMHSHYFTYTAHAQPSLGTIRELLVAMGAPSLPGFGESDGTGLIFHTRTASGNHPMQLTVDHSHEVQNGVYLELVTTIEQDQIEHGQVGPWLLGLLHQALRALDLNVVTGLG